MNKFLWLVGLPIAIVILSAVVKPRLRSIVSPIYRQQTAIAKAQPSTVLSIETSETSSKSDRLAHPPIRQTFTTGPYKLIISAENNWESPLAEAQLLQNNTPLWKAALPHQYGPKFVLINPNGNVLLLDEFINVASPHAITLINSQGSTIAQYGFEDIQTTLKLSTAELTQQATTGWWISTAPRLIDSGNCAVIATGNTLLEINLETGILGERNLSDL